MPKAVLLINLGTPDSPSVPDVRKYLRQFLNDPRVIDIGKAARYFLVNFAIIPRRAGNSAALYSSIWQERGSPLMFHSEDLTRAVAAELGPEYKVELGMRYGTPSIASALLKLQKLQPSELIVIPLYPQYASSSTGTALEEVFREIAGWQVIPTLKTLSRFYDDEKVNLAFVERASPFRPPEFDHVLFSFHGLPERQVIKASAETGANCCLKPGCCEVLNQSNYYCYRANSYHHARLLAGKLDLPDSRYTVCFQSRLWKEEWVKPYTGDVLRELATAGAKRILVMAPSFVADCLETIEEIGEEYRKLFLELGGEELVLVPGLNSHPAWVRSLCEIIRSS